MVKLEDIRYLIIPELYNFLKDLETGEGADISELEDAIASLTTAIGDSESGIVKDVADLESDVEALQTTVGDSESGIVKDVADLESAIGDETTPGSILARIKALEDAS